MLQLRCDDGLTVSLRRWQEGEESEPDSARPGKPRVRHLVRIHPGTDGADAIRRSPELGCLVDSVAGTVVFDGRVDGVLAVVRRPVVLDRGEDDACPLGMLHLC